MFDRLKRLLKDEPEPVEAPVDPDAADPVAKPPKGRGVYCTVCGTPMRMREGTRSYPNGGSVFFDANTGERAIEYYDWWACPRWEPLKASGHNAFRLSDIAKARWA